MFTYLDGEFERICLLNPHTLLGFTQQAVESSKDMHTQAFSHKGVQASCRRALFEEIYEKCTLSFKMLWIKTCLQDAHF